MRRNTCALLVANVIMSTAGLAQAPADPSPNPPAPAATEAYRLDELVTEQTRDDPLGLLSDRPSASAFGFDKPLLETPRSISYVSGEAIEALGLSAVEDLVRVVPGVYTTTRFGIQGSVDVRNVPADTYFRGMKRINLQGHGRSVLAAMDSIEVVKGPPSPIYGMGKIGGYVNMVPKSGRARLGGYLTRDEGFFQVIADSYGKLEASAGVGGPLRVGSRQGGYYVYGLFEDSDTYVRNVPVTQKIVQASISLPDVIGPFRLETGFSYQVSGTAGVFLNRWTQALVDDGRYITGSALANLDLNGNGKIGFREMNTGSPVRGNLSAANQPLSQRFNCPRDASGRFYPLGQFPTVAGIPSTMLTYLNANPAADPTGLLRAAGPGGPQPTSNQVPLGFVLDPRTVGSTTVDYRRPGAFERELEAIFAIAYVDLIYDKRADFSVRNQIFYDSQDQYKLSEQPGGGKQDVDLIEDKLTVTGTIDGLPRWLELEALGSANFRWTRATGYRYGGDFGTNRTDAMNNREGLPGPNETFVHPFENADINNDGAPWTSRYRTDYWEAGLGSLLDATLFERLNIIVGARWDLSGGRNTDYASFNATTGTAANPGRAGTADSSAHNVDDGYSWSISGSYALTPGLRPYATFARSSLTLESNNNKLDNAVINSGHLGEAELSEVGLKGSFLRNHLYLTLAAYEQTRTDVTVNDDASIVGAEVSSTETTGFEAEIKWVPSKAFSLSLYGLSQQTTYLIPVGGNILVDARTLGFRDVVDASGRVVYPAEAFLYGGRAFLVLPVELANLYGEKQGSPEVQFGLTATYDLPNGLGFTLNSTYFNEVPSGRLQLITLPDSFVVNLGASYKWGAWRAKLDVSNLTDERYFRARNGDTLADTLISVMPERRFTVTLTRSF